MKYVVVNKDGGKTRSADWARRLEILEALWGPRGRGPYRWLEILEWRRQSPRCEPGGQSPFTDAVGIVGRKPPSAPVARGLAERAL
jgi:hypothetical protein